MRNPPGLPFAPRANLKLTENPREIGDSCNSLSIVP